MDLFAGSGSRRQQIIRWAIFVVAVLVLVLLWTRYVMQINQVDGPSMEPTLQDHNELIVNKFDKTWDSLTGQTYIPKRGDIVIVSMGGLYSSSGEAEKNIVKRVIGLPGDHVVIKNGVLTIYNQQYPNGFDPDTTMPYGQKVVKPTTGSADIVIPKNYVYVMGDNRPVSLDSRYFGIVPAKDIVGKVELRVWPILKLTLF